MKNENGTAYFLVDDKNLEQAYKGGDPFYEWLISEGFKVHKTYRGGWSGVIGIWINLNNKIMAFGMPGIRCFEEIGHHAITIDEFKVIYKIYKKYEGKPPFEMLYDEEIELFKRQLNRDFSGKKDNTEVDFMDALFKDKSKTDKIKLDHYSWSESSVYRYYEKDFINKEIEDAMGFIINNPLFNWDMEPAKKAIRKLLKIVHYGDNLPSCSEWKDKKAFEREALENLVSLLKNSRNANILQVLDFVQNKLREAKLFENKKDAQLYERLKYELTECTLKEFEDLKKAVSNKNN
ncbi:MAG: hypothetical protein K2L12_08500 [Clostridia bacterium]|nr:hypothetical protein [Clostridia bacterium]